MSAFQKFNSLVEAMAEGKHNFQTGQLKVALCAAANAPVATNQVLADLTEISYTNLSSRNITTVSSSQSGGVYKLILTDLVLSASGGSVATFRYLVVFNDSAPSKELVAFYDYGSNLTLGDGENITLDFDGTNGLFTLTVS